MNTYTEIKVDRYERVVYCENLLVGLRAWIAIHNTNLGPSLGGCRIWNYATSDDAFDDVLRLSKGMTYKNALAGLALGGGKSVIWGDSTKIKSRELFNAFGDFVDHMNGEYIVAEDVGTTVSDIKMVNETTKHVSSLTSGNPSPYTALGVFKGLKETVKFAMKKDNLYGLNILVQGVGAVGSHLVELLSQENCNIFITDVNQEKLKLIANKFNVTVLEEDEMYKHTYDVFAPCALGGIINNETLQHLKCKVIAGAANNQLRSKNKGIKLMDQGILYAPDFVINSGGVINCAEEVFSEKYDEAVAIQKLDNIPKALLRIYERSVKENRPTNVIADELAEEIFNYE